MISLFVAVLSSACTSEESVDSGSSDPNAEGEPVYFEPVGYGQTRVVSDTIETVIRSEDSLRFYEQKLQMSRPLRETDFSQAAVLLAAVPAPTGGYTIEFETVEKMGEAILARYIIGRPDTECFTAMGTTTPYAAILIPRSDLEVHFEHLVEEVPCTFEMK